MKKPISLLTLCLLLSSTYAQDYLRTELENIIEELKTEDAFGLSVLPKEATLSDYSIERKELNILLNLSYDFLYQELNDQTVDEIIEHFSADLTSVPHPTDASPLFESILIKAKNEGNTFIELSDFLSENPIAITPNYGNDDPSPVKKGKPFIDKYSDVQAKGQLTGKTVWLSAGHGWIYDSRFKSFRTQRHNTHGLVEDFSNIEAVNYHLLKYLYNAGANVWTVRERDMNINEVIVDNDQGAPAYREYGRWATSSTKGRNNKTYRYSISKKSENASAVFTPTIPESGLYWVSVHYQNGYNRSVDVRYKIIHAGGASHVSINQEVHGNTWVYLGQFYFEKGMEGKVILSNASTESGQAIIADAVRFGGGVGDQGDCYHGKKSGEPRYEEGARYYAKYQGYPDCVGDISIRPRYAEWELAKGTKAEQKNAIYLSWHTNASGASGTESFVHRYKRRIGSRSLQRSIHKQMIKDIRGGYDRNWKDRGQKSADFGELRGLITMPGVLLEIGFHDNKKDAKALSDPQFRNLVARSVYKGITSYFEDHPTFLPEPPTHVVAKNIGNQKIKVTWKAPQFGGILGDRAKGYKVYVSQHGKAFAGGIESHAESLTIDNLSPGTTYYFKITATNEGGESFPTAVVAARTPSSQNQEADFLIVDGFDRLDRSLAILQKEKLPRYAPLGNTRRLYIEQMNNYDYAVEHATSMEAAGLAFDGASNEAIIDNMIDLNDYFGVNWFLGRESSTTETLSLEEQYQIKHFLSRGGVLMISGSELAYDLSKTYSGKVFYRDFLKAEFVGDDANHFRIASFVNDNFGGINGPLKNDSYGAYLLRSPDIIKATNGSRPVLQYKNGKTAATAYRGDFAVINFGFPLEAIGDQRLRNEIFRKSIQYLDPIREVEQGIAVIPKSFSNKLSIDLNRAAEGKAIFNLYDALGQAVFRKTWSHDGKSTKTFYLEDIPEGSYTYEFMINGKNQEGKIMNKK